MPNGKEILRFTEIARCKVLHGSATTTEAVARRAHWIVPERLARRWPVRRPLQQKTPPGRAGSFKDGFAGLPRSGVRPRILFQQRMPPSAFDGRTRPFPRQYLYRTPVALNQIRRNL
jgi:hypothetical protein